MSLAIPGLQTQALSLAAVGFKTQWRHTLTSDTGVIGATESTLDRNLIPPVSHVPVVNGVTLLQSTPNGTNPCTLKINLPILSLKFLLPGVTRGTIT